MKENKKAGRKKKLQGERVKVYTFCIRPSHEPIIRAFIKRFKEEHEYEIHIKKNVATTTPKNDDWAIGKL
jgi:hypothetical protein